MKGLLALTCAGQFMVLLDNTIVGAALPDMQQRLHTGLTGLQWIVDAYVLLVAMLLLSGTFHLATICDVQAAQGTISTVWRALFA
ncbi:MFS transporter, partial [Nonomuraea sp. NPDC049695]